MLELCKEIDQTRLAAKLDFIPGQPIGVTVTNRVVDSGQGHAVGTMRFIQKVVDYVNLQGIALRGSVLLWLEDGIWEWDHKYARRVPLLTFSRRFDDHYSLLYPDPAFMDNGYAPEREKIDEIEKVLDWNKKTPTLFWRGASSGLGMGGDEWMECERIALALAAKRLGRPDMLDAKISLVDVNPECPAYNGMYDLGLVGEYRDFYDFLSYRYLIDVDGHSSAWRSLFLKLYSKSAVVKIKGDHLQWYYDRLLPWINYVPVRQDSKDIEEIYHWLCAHDGAAREIADAGRELVSTISLESGMAETGRLLVELLSYWRED